MAYETIIFEGVQLLRNRKSKGPGDNPKRFSNFGGTMIDNGRFKSNARYFNIRVPEDMVDILKEKHVYMWNPSEPDENGNLVYMVQVDISMTKTSPEELKCKAYLVNEDNKRSPLDKNTIALIDNTEFKVKCVNVTCGISEKQNKPGECKLWANTIYIFQAPSYSDPWDSEYRDDNGSNDDIPFDT